jgi:PKD repeat protein
MRKCLLLILLLGLTYSQSFSFEKKSIVERYTNFQCGPCANVNNSWYNSRVSGLVNAKEISHIVYNVNWPGAADPMYLLNAAQNSIRWGYYGVNSVPWIVVNGSTITVSDAALTTAVTNGNNSFSPFKLEVVPEIFSNNSINVKVYIIRDTAVTIVGENTRLRIGITEKAVQQATPPALEPVYYDITRRLLPDAKGMKVNIPEPGDTVVLETMYIPDAAFLAAVNLDSLGVVVFLQNDDTKEIYQSAMQEIESSNNINAAFTASDNFGALPLVTSFIDYSTPTDSTSITSYKWDFNNDGVIDSEDPAPEWTYTDEGVYAVSLTVSDGVNQHVRIVQDYITVITTEEKILVVNGIDYRTATYIPEMIRFYGSSAPYGNKQVDVWDLFGDQEFDYAVNPLVSKVHLYNRDVPLAVMKHYDKVIWIGNNYSGDLALFKPSVVLDYLALGGNFLLATRTASAFFNTDLRDYAGIASFTGDMQVDQINAADSNLADMTTLGVNNLVHLFTISPTSPAEVIFTNNATGAPAGFRMKKDDEGAFIFISGRPYRYDTLATRNNYEYIINNWMTGQIVGVKENESSVPESFALQQNYPNPFNPVTVINYTVAVTGKVNIKVYDILGNEVSILVNSVMSPGVYNSKFNASSLPSGIYIYRMEAEGVNISKKMLLLK